MYRLLFVLLSAFFWARLAHILGHPGSILGHLGFILDHLGSIWGHPGSILAPQSLPSLPRLPQGFPRCSPEAPRAKNHKSTTKASRRDRFLDKSSKKSEGQTFSRNLLKRSLLEGFAQSVQKIMKNKSLLETFLLLFAKDFLDSLLKRGVHQTPTSEKGSDSG